MTTEADPALRRDLRRIVALESTFFGIEVAVALGIGSVALLADSIDFLEDASISMLVLIALGWSVAARARLGMVLACVLLIPTLATLAIAWEKFNAPLAPAALPLTLTALAALVVNGSAAWLLAQHHAGGGSMVKAAFLSARNDMVANVAIIVAGVATAFVRSAWPDLVVGVAIALLNIGAAKEVFEAARSERRSALGMELI